MTHEQEARTGAFGEVLGTSVTFNADGITQITRPGDATPELRDAIADAIASADVGFSMNLVRLVDGVHTYTLRYGDGETLEFCDDETDDYDAQDRLYAHVRARKRQLQADAVLAVLNREVK